MTARSPRYYNCLRFIRLLKLAVFTVALPVLVMMNERTNDQTEKLTRLSNAFSCKPSVGGGDDDDDDDDDDDGCSGVCGVVVKRRRVLVDVWHRAFDDACCYIIGLGIKWKQLNIVKLKSRSPFGRVRLAAPIKARRWNIAIEIIIIIIIITPLCWKQQLLMAFAFIPPPIGIHILCCISSQGLPCLLLLQLLHKHLTIIYIHAKREPLNKLWVRCSDVEHAGH